MLLLAFCAAETLVSKFRVKPITTAQAPPQTIQVRGSSEIQDHPECHTIVQFNNSTTDSRFYGSIWKDIPHHAPRFQVSDGPSPRLKAVFAKRYVYLIGLLPSNRAWLPRARIGGETPRYVFWRTRRKVTCFGPQAFSRQIQIWNESYPRNGLTGRESRLTLTRGGVAYFFPKDTTPSRNAG